MGARYEINLHFGKAEEEALEQLVNMGLFSNRDEAARAAILKYAMDIGVLDRGAVWRKLIGIRKRRVTPAQLKEDLETLEDET
jgi:Arc/MetJ-type ribon-helix-helix transcriptional regulator